MEEKTTENKNSTTSNDEIETVPVDKVKCLVLNDIVEEGAEDANGETVTEVSINHINKVLIISLFSSRQEQ